MASAFTHAVVALSIGSWFYRPSISKSVWIAGMTSAVLPDLDSIGFRFHIPYASLWGHRGFTHSIVFAGLLASSLTMLLLRLGKPQIKPLPLLIYLFLATASHGILDATTDGGLGVAFFSPFSPHRYFFPWRPIQVSPISITRFFTSRGFAVLQSELLWVWVPAILFASTAFSLRELNSRRTTSHMN